MNARVPPVLHRASPRFFVLFLALTVWAFWPSYFSRLFEQPSVLHHAHGIVLASWLVMLVAQAQLIRTQRRSLHRQLGKLSYVLAPAVVVVTTAFVHQRMAPGLAGYATLPVPALLSLALMLGSLVVFAVFYGFAIAKRRDSQTHARWMVCTVFPMFTPVTDRLIAVHWQTLIGVLPRIDGNPVLPVAGFALADVLLVALSWWDWRANRRLDVFPVALGVLLVYHVATLTLHLVPAWNAFGAWFLSLPLS
ncbi:MAG TPA: DUF2306 domain-containing protein [Gammaproteobacteria bacterium]|nr:DUF2306 domain-containing protein [Gammaproteobacteria bacterium]